MSVYKDFLRLLDFSEDETEHILPDWEQACKSLGLNESDVRFATDEWLPKHWDLVAPWRPYVYRRLCSRAHRTLQVIRVQGPRRQNTLLQHAESPCVCVCEQDQRRGRAAHFVPRLSAHHCAQRLLPQAHRARRRGYAMYESALRPIAE